MVNVTLDTALPFVLVLPSYLTYKYYPSGSLTGYNVNVSDDQQPEFRSLSVFYMKYFSK
jgi:hypothetical protein